MTKTLIENRRAYLEYLYKRLGEIDKKIKELKEEKEEVGNKINEWFSEFFCEKVVPDG